MSNRKIGDLNGPWAALLRFSLVMSPIIVTTLLTWGTWLTSKAFGHDAELAKMVDSRFTTANGKELELAIGSKLTAADTKIATELARMWQQIADNRAAIAKLPIESPPKWFVDRMDRIEANQGRVQDQIESLRDQVSLLKVGTPKDH